LDRPINPYQSQSHLNLARALRAAISMDPVDSSAKSTPGSNGSNSASPLPGVASPPERSNSQSSAHKPGHIAAHRQSFAENQRYPPPSPRAHRHPSFTQQAIQDLLINPPSNRHANVRYAGRDWRDIALSELVPDEARWADLDTSVEEATMVRWPVINSHNSCSHAMSRHSSKTTRAT
jgi:hypothetical protein